jgi:hypothetical protein
LEVLPTSNVSSILRRGNNSHRTMLTTSNTKMSFAEAAILPCRHSFDEKRRSGYVLALAGRDAR